jgi:hypothetical protein
LHSGESASIESNRSLLTNRHKSHLCLERNQIADLYFPDHLYVDIAETRTEHAVELSKRRWTTNRFGVEPVCHSIRSKELVNCIGVELIPNSPEPFSYDGFVG